MVNKKKTHTDLFICKFVTKNNYYYYYGICTQIGEKPQLFY